ncbi:MAG: hypothetical protein M3680_06430 [Myxococcota bacterium]|nr:hypothetical protein [Myxococcota bacterium]
MEKRKQTPADRTKRQPRDPGPDRKRSGWSPSDDLYGDGRKTVDADLDLDEGSYSKPRPKP